jgi:CBS domain-containing protein
MNIQATVDHILHQKGRQVWTVSPEMTVLDAIRLLAEKNVGALIVAEGDILIGMFSERDYTRKIILKGRSSKETKVGEIVSTPVQTVTPQDTVEDCMRLMTEHRIRHLPVLQAGKIAVVISIGDLVNWIISTQKVALEQMESYLSGGYPTHS